ncbi:hypothetical protein V473_08330 [Sphingobium cupriresistens LL01]|uniref:Uncharacterized protein n=1 Tax=Sphingobium cupriresistens LL01 TaxID=1420583 RepID=A0A0J7Y4K2_9SPHN|nr:hypothetical protein V473_08330 [Sphingobium cupriresistens LL01]
MASQAIAENGVVLLDGLDGVAAAMTADAAGGTAGFGSRCSRGTTPTVGTRLTPPPTSMGLIAIISIKLRNLHVERALR